MEWRGMRGGGQPAAAYLGAAGVDAREADAVCACPERLLSDEGAWRTGARAQQRALAGNVGRVAAPESSPSRTSPLPRRERFLRIRCGPRLGAYAGRAGRRAL